MFLFYPKKLRLIWIDLWHFSSRNIGSIGNLMFDVNVKEDDD